MSSGKDLKGIDSKQAADVSIEGGVADDLQYGHVIDIDNTVDIDNAYLQSSKMTRFLQGVLFQMILFGALSFVGPAMSDAISNLGGGGLSTP